MKNVILIFLLFTIKSFSQSEEAKIYDSLDEALKNPTNVKKLYLIDKDLVNLSNEVLQLSNLEEIVLDKNPQLNLIRAIDVLSKLKKLKSLSLGENQYTSLPNEIGNLKSLEDLDLDDNEFQEFPESVKQIYNLKYLSFFSNKLSQLDFKSGDFPNLISINLCYNSFKNFPIKLSMLPKLKRVIIWHNEIENISKNIGEFGQLEELNIESNKLKKIPKQISNLKNLKILSIRGNYFTEKTIMPIFKIESLENVDFESNRIKYFSEEIGNLQNIKRLNFSKNPINSIPKSLIKLNKLEQIGLGGLPIMNWSEAFSILSNIESLDRVGMYSMEKQTMPEGFENLKQVKTFWLTFNSFDSKEKERLKKALPNADLVFN